EQLEALTALVSNCDKYDALCAERDQAQGQRDAAWLYFSELKIELLDAEVHQRERQADNAEAQARQCDERVRRLAAEREPLIADRASVGGNRLGVLEQTITHARETEEQRRRSRRQYDQHVYAAGFEPVDDAAGFAALH